MSRYRLGIDIGGTFTDFLLADEATGAIHVGKQLTTPRDPSDGLVAGTVNLLQKHGIPASQVDLVVHGTTLVTNAVIERKGAHVGLITTEGMRDVLEIARELRYDIYDLQAETPEPLVPRRLRLGVRERTTKDGDVETPLDVEHLSATLDRFRQEQVDSVAVCFFHSYKNPSNERLAGAFIGERWPDLSVSLSSEVFPEIREYERTSTTVINAYVKPLAERYLVKLVERLGELGFSGTVLIMLSNGGLTRIDTARRVPVRMIESGPAGGCMAAAFYSAMCDYPDLLALDMGGTTAKMSLIQNGEPAATTSFEAARVHRFKKGSGFPVMVPAIDLIEIGAGGGSIAWIDPLGLLRVGPESSGADPGPACYGLGGTQPTVTDADVILGYLDPGYFLGGELALDRQKAEVALAQHVGNPLGIDAVAAARAVYRLVNENMANAARIHVLEKGRDPRQFALLAFGGAGPVHVRQVGKLLNSPLIISPLAAGVTSALGFLTTPIAMDFVRSHVASLEEMDWDYLNGLLREMEEEGAAELALSGVSRGEVSFIRLANLRYVGQGREIPVPIPSGRLDAGSIPAIRTAFEKIYVDLFERCLPETPIESISWRVTASGPRPRLELARSESMGSAAAALKRHRPVFFEEFGEFRDTPVYDRYRLLPGATVVGPAILEEREATLVVGPGEQVSIDAYMNALVELSSGLVEMATATRRVGE